jgi:hypothetical protein
MNETRGRIVRGGALFVALLFAFEGPHPHKHTAIWLSIANLSRGALKKQPPKAAIKSQTLHKTPVILLAPETRVYGDTLRHAQSVTILSARIGGRKGVWGCEKLRAAVQGMQISGGGGGGGGGDGGRGGGGDGGVAFDMAQFPPRRISPLQEHSKRGLEFINKISSIVAASLQLSICPGRILYSRSSVNAMLRAEEQRRCGAAFHWHCATCLKSLALVLATHTPQRWSRMRIIRSCTHVHAATQ